MNMLNDKQKRLLRSLGLPIAFDALNDDQLIHIEDVLADELQLRGVNDAGDGLNAYGKLCRSCIESLPD